MPNPEEWAKLKAEWMHDYELRRMEDRGLKYEDEVNRDLDHAVAGGGHDRPATGRTVQEPATTVTPPGRASQPPHPWPSEIARENQHQPGKDHGNGHENGHDAGHSM